MTDTSVDPRHMQALEQARRLSGLLGYPRTTDGESELVAALLTAAPTTQAAEHLVDEALRSLERCPPPQYFYAQAEARRPAAKRRETGCRVCDGVGSIEWPYLARPDQNGLFQTERLALLVDEPPSSPDYQMSVRAALSDWRTRRAAKLRSEGVEDLELFGRNIERVVLVQESCPNCRRAA